MTVFRWAVLIERKGDAHSGVTVQHRSRVAADPTQPNLRQVHLIHAELFTEVSGQGYDVSPGDLGENITTQGIDLLSLPRGTRLHIGADAVIEVTGLRNPCQQITTFQPGLLKQVLTKNRAGELIRKAGIMGVVVTGGVVGAPDDTQAGAGTAGPYPPSCCGERDPPHSTGHRSLVRS